MKLATIMIVVQAVFMLASVAVTCYMMYGIKKETNTKTGLAIWEANKKLFYVIAGLHGVSLFSQGLSVFWCKGR